MHNNVRTKCMHSHTAKKIIPKTIKETIQFVVASKISWSKSNKENERQIDLSEFRKDLKVLMSYINMKQEIALIQGEIDNHI